MAKQNSEKRRLSSRKRKKGRPQNFNRDEKRAKIVPLSFNQDEGSSNSKCNTRVQEVDVHDLSASTAKRTDEVNVPHVNVTRRAALEGNRIINISYFLKQLLQICSHGHRFGCTFENLVVTQEIQCGLSSKFVMQCNMCQEVFHINSQETQTVVDINTLAVKGIMFLKLSATFLSSIMEIVRRLANHAKSLLVDVDSNVAEHYNAIVAKFIGAKRINYALKNSYSARCSAAVVAHNSKMPHTIFKSKILPDSKHGTIMNKIEIRRRAKCARQKMLRQNKPYSQTYKKPHGPDKDYGDECQRPDLEPEIYKEAANIFLQNLHRNEFERQELEQQTRDQSKTGLWMEERRKLITASNFAKICKRRKCTDTSALVKQILYSVSELSNVKSIKHGIWHEEDAIKAVEVFSAVKVSKVGLCIDELYPYIGASPDGVVDDQTIVEVKCPYSPYKLNLNIEEAISAKKITFWRKDKKGEIKLNKNHQWFFQVQGQLHVTKKSKCLFGVWIGKHFKMEIIERDDNFWTTKMEPKLKEFYLKALLPELVDSRRSRNLPIRNIIV